MLPTKPTESKEDLSPSAYCIISLIGAKLPEQYRPLIYSKWLRSLRYGNPLFKKIEQSQYYSHYHAYIESLLKKPDAVVKLAVLAEDADVVLGFSASREDVLDYMHIHADYRRHGIGKALMPEGITTFTHLTLTALKIWQENEKYRHLKFNPFA